MEIEPLLSTLNHITLRPLTLDSIGLLFLSIILLFLSGYISGSEVAFFSLNPTQLKELEESKSIPEKKIVTLLQQPDKLLATILIANNFVNVSIVILLELFFTSWIDFGGATLLQFIFQSVLLTFLLLLFGEIMPKIFSSYNPLRMARWAASFLTILVKAFRPFSHLLIASTSIVSNRMVRKNTNLSVDELSHALELTGEGIHEEKEILQGILTFGDKTVEEIMTPRIDICDLTQNATYAEVLRLVIDSGYSRIPIYEETQDNIKGILYSKDLLPYLDKNDDFRWQSLIRPVYFVPASKPIDNLLEEFQAQKIHLAIVIDEYGGTMGLVSLEDILEEIVGEIADEYDEEERLYHKIDDDNFIFEGKIQLNDFFKITQIDEEEFDKLSGEAETLAGILLELKGNFPTPKETILFRNYSFRVLEMNKKRIVKIKFSRNVEP